MEAEWKRLLDEAVNRARTKGRNDVADYLALRAVNDATRKVGIEWLLRAFVTVAENANLRGLPIQIEQTDVHRFQVGASTMVGARLILRAGVRQLILEAGYPQTARHRRNVTGARRRLALIAAMDGAGRIRRARALCRSRSPPPLFND